MVKHMQVLSNSANTKHCRQPQPEVLSHRMPASAATRQLAQARASDGVEQMQMQMHEGKRSHGFYDMRGA